MALIQLENVTVEFVVPNSDMQSLRSQLIYIGSAGTLKRDARNHVRVVALKNVNLRADVGDRIALIGRNGAGKSTLLRVLSGIYSPLRGRVRVSGRVATVLGGGLGVDEEVTETVISARILKVRSPAASGSLATTSSLTN